jgi:hypothetical protein
MNADADVITVPVAINVTDVQRFQGCGSLTAMAVVTVDIYEVPLT